ncbi:MAG TPA: lipid A deacylase LpxR family protein [Longimicrobium sp.]|jgi:hypothetical protein
MARSTHRSPGLRRAAALVLAAAALAPAPAAAQVRAVRLTLDNDAYDFWVPAWRRPDHEYTNGMDAALELAGGPVWARLLAPAAPPCSGAEDPGAACAGTTVALGQKIFAPRVDGPTLQPGDRPYAGWLYLSATGQLSSASTRRSLGIEVGVTGPPSLAEAVHRGWHQLAGFWEPVGWGNQIGFEPGVTVRYDEARLLGELRAGGVRVATLAPEWGAAVGNVLTDARVGVRASAGLAVPHPWSTAADRGQGPVSVYAVAAARQDAVAHSLFLDGPTFAEGPGVERRPFVFQYEVGGGVRVGRLALEYRAVTRGREYRTEPGGHTHGTFALAWRPRVRPALPPLAAPELPEPEPRPGDGAAHEEGPK